MQRDWNLIRTLLFRLRASTPDEWIEVKEAEEAAVVEHLKLLKEGGLLEYEVAYSNHWSVYSGRLTWQGHEFAESVQDESLYRKAIEEAQKAGVVSFEIIKATIVEPVKRSILPD